MTIGNVYDFVMAPREHVIGHTHGYGESEIRYCR